MGSSDYINYAIRPNKTVERKLIFETLARLSTIYDFANYRYVGFGSVWFVDFVLAHKHLLISDMVSIERDEYIASRAAYNRPYACVDVVQGDSELVLPSLLREKKVVVWCDYDTSLSGPVLTDLATLCRDALTGSVVIATINANKSSLPRDDENGREFGNDEARLRYCVRDFPEIVPRRLPKTTMQKAHYRGFLGRMIFQHMRRQVHTAGRVNDQVVPLCNIAYSDNASMITVGAAIVDAQGAKETDGALGDRGIGPMDEENQLTIGVPPLTLREKQTLDQLMPCGVAPTETEVLERLGFRMKPSQIEAYHRFYRFYPMFGEVAI